MNHTQLNDTDNNTTIPVPTPVTEVTRKGKRWTPEEDERLLTHLYSNMTFDDIAVNHQRTLGGITMRVLMHAVTAVKDGMPVEDASLHYRLPVERITQGINIHPKLPKPVVVNDQPTGAKPRTKGKRWTTDEDTHLRLHLTNGVSLEDIAIAHQRTVPAIKRRALTLAVAACTNGLSPEEASRVYRVSIDKLTQRVPIITPVPANPQVDVLIEIRDLLRVLVAHVTKEQLPVTI